MQIESNLYQRQGSAITNFDHTLPAPQSDLAQSLLKSEYNFEFLDLRDKVSGFCTAFCPVLLWVLATPVLKRA